MARTAETAEQRAHREACEVVKLRYQDGINAIAKKVRLSAELSESERRWVASLIESAGTQAGNNWLFLTSLTYPES